jgi:hypothetical protein
MRLPSTLLTVAAVLGVGGFATTAHAKRDPKDTPIVGKFGRNGKGIGIGASLGDPMGLSIKWFVRAQHALSWHLAWGLLHHGDGLVQMDYAWHTKPIGSSDIVDAHFYIGGGIGVGFWAKPGPRGIQTHERPSRAGAGMIVRAPVLGLAYHWYKVPLDTSLEISYSPYLVLPDWLHGDASIKVRYFF